MGPGAPLNASDFIHTARTVHAARVGVIDEPGGENISSLEVEAVLERLAGVKVPNSFEAREALPRTATGKVQKFALRAPYRARQ